MPTVCWARVTHTSCRFILRTTWEAGAAVTHSAQENEADGVRPAVPASGKVRLGLQDSGRRGWGGGTLKRGSSQLGGFMRILISLAATSSLRNQKEVDDEEKAETLPGLVSGGTKGWGRGGSVFIRRQMKQIRAICQQMLVPSSMILIELERLSPSCKFWIPSQCEFSAEFSMGLSHRHSKRFVNSLGNGCWCRRVPLRPPLGRRTVSPLGGLAR